MGVIRALVLLLALALGPGWGEAVEVPVCSGSAPVPWQELAPGLWVWAPAAPVDVGPDNGGFVAPVTAVVDQGEALVVDPGPSHAHGLRVRESLLCRFGARVTAVVNTHAHAENVLANSAFADAQARGRLRVWATAGTASAMRERCVQCLQSLRRLAGPGALADTELVWPDAVLREGDVLAVGRHRLRVSAVVRGHTEADLVLWHPGARVVWAGGLVYGGRVPELAQGGLLPWLEALDHLQALAPRVVVAAGVFRAARPGAVPEALLDTRRYLDALRQQVLQAMDQGLSAWDADQLEQPGFAHWVGYAARHGFNVQRAWRELELHWMAPDSAQEVGR